MNLRIATLLALAVSASLFVAPARADQQRGTLPRGGSYVLHTDASTAGVAVELWFRAPSSGYDNATPGLSQLAVTACAASKLVGGKSLVDLVASVGGRLNVNVYSDMATVSVTGPAPAARRIIAGITAAYFAPSIDADALKLAQRDAAVQAVERRYSVDLTLHDALFAQLFASGPARVGPLPDDVQSLAHLPLDAILAFAKRAFRSSNALLVLAGNADASQLDAVTDGDGGTSMDKPYDSTVAATPKNVDVQGNVSGIGLAWTGPAISDERAATAMDFVNDYLFRDQTGTFQRAIASTGTNASVSGVFVTLHDPGVMLLSISGDSPKVRTMALDAVAALAQPLDARTFAAAQTAFLYHMASDAQTPLAVADNLGWYAAQGNAAYAPGDTGGAYLRAARSLDPQFVADVVRRYLRTPVVVQLAVPGKGPAS
jgi:predicted Zn-dependent peptidase